MPVIEFVDQSKVNIGRYPADWLYGYLKRYLPGERRPFADIGIPNAPVDVVAFANTDETASVLWSPGSDTDSDLAYWTLYRSFNTENVFVSQNTEEVTTINVPPGTVNVPPGFGLTRVQGVGTEFTKLWGANEIASGKARIRIFIAGQAVDRIVASVIDDTNLNVTVAYPSTVTGSLYVASFIDVSQELSGYYFYSVSVTDSAGNTSLRSSPSAGLQLNPLGAVGIRVRKSREMISRQRSSAVNPPIPDSTIYSVELVVMTNILGNATDLTIVDLPSGVTYDPFVMLSDPGVKPAIFKTTVYNTTTGVQTGNPNNPNKISGIVRYSPTNTSLVFTEPFSVDVDTNAPTTNFDRIYNGFNKVVIRYRSFRDDSNGTAGNIDFYSGIDHIDIYRGLTDSLAASVKIGTVQFSEKNFIQGNGTTSYFEFVDNFNASQENDNEYYYRSILYDKVGNQETVKDLTSGVKIGPKLMQPADVQGLLRELHSSSTTAYQIDYGVAVNGTKIVFYNVGTTGDYTFTVTGIDSHTDSTNIRVANWTVVADGSTGSTNLLLFDKNNQGTQYTFGSNIVVPQGQSAVLQWKDGVTPILSGAYKVRIRGTNLPVISSPTPPPPSGVSFYCRVITRLAADEIDAGRLRVEKGISVSRGGTQGVFIDNAGIYLRNSSGTVVGKLVNDLFSNFGGSFDKLFGLGGTENNHLFTVDQSGNARIGNNTDFLSLYTKGLKVTRGGTDVTFVTGDFEWGSAVSGSELLTNPQFNGTTAGWSLSGGVAVTTGAHLVDPGPPQVEDIGLAARFWYNSGTQGVLSQTISCSAVSTYQFSFYFKLTAGTVGKAQVKLYQGTTSVFSYTFGDAFYNDDGSGKRTTPIAPVWQRVAFSHFTGDGSLGNTLKLEITGQMFGSDPAGQLSVDYFSAKKYNQFAQLNAAGLYVYNTPTSYVRFGSGLAEVAVERMTVGSDVAKQVVIDGVLGAVYTANYVSGPSGKGWYIDNDIAEFNNVTVRGVFSTSVFRKQTVNAIGGIFMVSNSDVLDAPMTASDTSSLVTREVTFPVNEILRIKDETRDEWLRVTAVSGRTHTVTRDLAGTYAAGQNPAWTPGTAVVSFGNGGVSTSGFILMDASSANSPFIDVYARNSSVYNDYTLKLRAGYLAGAPDTPELGFTGAAKQTWGMWSSNVFLTGGIVATFGRIGGFAIDSTNLYSPTSSLSTATVVLNSSTPKIAVGANANSITLTSGTGVYAAGNGDFKAGSTTNYMSFNSTTGVVTMRGTSGSTIGFGATSYSVGTGIWIDGVGSTNAFRVGNPVGARAQWTGTNWEIYNASNSLVISIGSSNIVAGFTATTAELTFTSAGNTTKVSTVGSYAFQAGPTAAPSFTVTHAGELTATNATIKSSGTAKRIEINVGGSNEMVFISDGVTKVRIGTDIWTLQLPGIHVTDGAIFAKTPLSVGKPAITGSTGIDVWILPQDFIGVFGGAVAFNNSTLSRGVWGFATCGTGTTSTSARGVVGEAGGAGGDTQAIGVYGKATGGGTGGNWAGYFDAGDVKITNMLDLSGSLKHGSNTYAPLTTPGLIEANKLVAVNENKDVVGFRKIGITRANGTALEILSGNTANFVALEIGRASAEGALGVASGAGIYSNVAATGDVVLRNQTANLILAARNTNGEVWLTTGAADGARLKVKSSQVEILTTLKYSGTNITGSGSAALGNNAPGATPSQPYTWFQMQASDGTTVYVPAWA
jgi:hypothetical protein